MEFKDIKEGLDRYISSIKSLTHKQPSNQIKFFVEPNNSGEVPSYGVFAHNQSSSPAHLINVFSNKDNADLFCKIMEAEEHNTSVFNLHPNIIGHLPHNESTTITTNTLEPRYCPFCGGTASLNIDPDGIRDSEGRWWAYNVVCNKCAATTGICYSKEQAISSWNERFEPPYNGSVPAGNARLK